MNLIVKHSYRKSSVAFFQEGRKLPPVSTLINVFSCLFSFDLGVYVKPTEEENRKFDERVKWLENVMAPRRELYEAEEKTLRVMLAEEEEEKEKERRENERKNQGTGPSSFSIGVCILMLFTYIFL